MKTRNPETDQVGQSGVYPMQRRICSQAALFAVVAALIFVFLEEKAVAKGLLLGTLFSVVNFVLLGKSIPLALGRSRPKAGMIGLASIFGRYIFLAVPMVIAIKSASFNFFAVVVGLFAVQLVMLIEYTVVKPLLDGK